MPRPTPEDVERVVQFRNRLVAYATEIVQSDRERPHDQLMHLASEQAALSQEYGSLAPVIARHGGLAGMHQFGMVVSQDVIRDAIQRPDHPSYSQLVQMAIGQLDVAIGAMRQVARPAGFTVEDAYRVTSPIYWAYLGIAAVRWLIGTSRGRIVAVLGAVVLAIVAGAAQAWFEVFFRN